MARNNRVHMNDIELCKKKLSYFQSCRTDIERGVKLFTGMF